MRPIYMRVVGILIIFASFIGMVLGAGGMILLWRAEPTAATAIIRNIDLVDRSLIATSTMLTVAGETLEQVDTNIVTIQESVSDAGDTMSATSAATGSVANMIGNDFTNVIIESQRSLISVQNSAKIIDSTLSIISYVPGLGSGYNRNLPLEGSIREVSESLAGVPESLAEVQSGLNETARNFELLQGDLNRLSVTIGEIETSLKGAEGVMEEYQEIVAESQDALQQLRNEVPSYVRMFILGSTVFLIWFLLAQLALLTQGIELLRRDLPPSA
jgi:chromosome segregation ATPase